MSLNSLLPLQLLGTITNINNSREEFFTSHRSQSNVVIILHPVGKDFLLFVIIFSRLIHLLCHFGASNEPTLVVSV